MALDIMKIDQEGPYPVNFIWEGFPAGIVGALVSPGGTGKSFFALQAAFAVAGGRDLLGLNIQHTGPVVYLAAEDSGYFLANRVYTILRQLEQEQKKIVAENLIIEPIFGKRLNIMREDHLKRVIEFCQGTRLLILDTISRVHTLDENSNSDMEKLISTLEYIIEQTETTVLFLHHTNKLAAYAGLTDQQQAARGASALIDNIRWCAFLCKMTEKEANQYTESTHNKPIPEEERGRYLRFGVSKNNYAQIPKERWFKREKGGLLVPVRLEKIADKTANKTKAKRWQYEE